jgi:hypothetical protein
LEKEKKLTEEFEEEFKSVQHQIPKHLDGFFSSFQTPPNLPQSSPQPNSLSQPSQPSPQPSCDVDNHFSSLMELESEVFTSQDFDRDLLVSKKESTFKQ